MNATTHPPMLPRLSAGSQSAATGARATGACE
jgi:hypothetical protein